MKKKERYFSPETEVMEIRLEGMIAASDMVTDSIDVMDWSTGSDFPVNF